MRTKTELFRLFKHFIFTIAIIIVSATFISADAIPISVDIPQKQIVFFDSITRDNINEIIARDPVFYLQKYAYNLNRNLLTIQLIWKWSSHYNVPFNLSLAVGLEESELINYNPKRPVNVNEDGSFDWGIYQLNSKTYPDVINKFGSLESNIKQGNEHLSYEYKKTGVWDIAAMTFNCGNIGNVGKKTLARLRIVLHYEKDLYELVNSVYRDKISRVISCGEIPK